MMKPWDEGVDHYQFWQVIIERNYQVLITFTSTLRDLDDPRGDGERDRRDRRFEKLPLW